MTSRTETLRCRSLDARPAISSERAVLLTAFYREQEGRHSPPVMRALAFRHLCEHKTLYLGDGELIVGERGPAPKAVSDLPRAHLPQPRRPPDPRRAAEDELRRVPRECLEDYERLVIPYWQGRSLRDKLFAALPPEWIAAYEAGMFTEFMEQRAPGHTVLDDKIYRQGLLDFKRDIAEAIAALDLARRSRGLARSARN